MKTLPETAPNETHATLVVSANDADNQVYSHPLLVSFVYPIVTTLVTYFIIRLTTRRKETADRKKVEAEVEQIKSSYQPVVISTLQLVQNEILKDKVNTLKMIIASKSNLFNIKQQYNNGEPIIADEYHYHENMYNQLSDGQLVHFEKKILINADLFPDKIKAKFQDLMAELSEIKEIQNKEFSLQMQQMPYEVSEKFNVVSKTYDDLIDLIRKNLHLDNEFIQEYISYHQSVTRNN